MGARVYRLVVGVGTGPEIFSLAGDLHIEAARDRQGRHVVEFWYEHRDDVAATARTFEVFGTGHDLPDGAVWRGTTARTPDGFVWHLYEIPTPEVPS